MSNPFGGGQTGGGPGSPLNGPEQVAGQFGGPPNGGVGLISIGGYFDASAAMQAGPLHLVLLPGSFVAVARLSNGAVDKAGSITDIRYLEKQYQYQFGEPGYPPVNDSPAMELEATFEISNSNEASAAAVKVNVADFYTAYTSAQTYALALAFMLQWFTIQGTKLNSTQAAAYLAAAGIKPN
jgi:hypothetical protein